MLYLLLNDASVRVEANILLQKTVDKRTINPRISATIDGKGTQ